MNNGTGISQSTANAAFTRATNTKSAVNMDFGGTGSNSSFENTLQSARQKVARSEPERPSTQTPREPATPRQQAPATKDNTPLRADHLNEKKLAVVSKTEQSNSPAAPPDSENTELAAAEEASSMPGAELTQEETTLETLLPGNNGVLDKVITGEVDPGKEEPLLTEGDAEELLPEELLNLEEGTKDPIEEEAVAVAVETDEAVPTPQVAPQAAPASLRADATPATAESVAAVNKVTVDAGKSSGAPVMEEAVAGSEDMQLPEESLLAKAGGSASRTAVPGETNTAQVAETRTAPPTSAVIAETTRAAESLAVAGRGFTVQSQVGVPMGHPQWNQAVVNRVMWLSAQNLPSAEIRLDPPELGPLQVRIQVQNDHVQVNFVSQNPNVRDALDQQANRLREMFAENGMSLDVGVSDQAFSRRDQEQSSGGGNRNNADAGSEEEQPAAARIIRLVDHYA